MFQGNLVLHSKYGSGEIVKVEDSHIVVRFGNEVKEFIFPDSIGTFLKTDDDELIAFAKIKKEEKAFAMAVKKAEEKKIEEDRILKRHAASDYTGDFETPLLGKKSLDIEFKNKKDFFEALGYLAKPGVIAYYQAEVPDDGKDDLFEKLFPNQEFRRIYVNSGVDGHATKQGCQFRINLSTTKNCPDSLKPHLGTPSGNWVGRINRSKFSLKLVQKYGFRFGYKQNYEDIYSKIPEEFKNDFTRGYNL